MFHNIFTSINYLKESYFNKNKNWHIFVCNNRIKKIFNFSFLENSNESNFGESEAEDEDEEEISDIFSQHSVNESD